MQLPANFDTAAVPAESPVVTIVTPTFNREKLLRATIESVLSQTYPRIQYIVVDDGSTDGTKALCSGFPGVEYVYQRNAGQSAAINAGWGLAKGKYLMYLSSDDLLKPRAVAELVQLAEQVGERVVVYPDYDVIDEHGTHTSDVVLGPFVPELFFAELKCVMGPGVLFSRSLFEEFGGWNGRLRQVPDYEYWLRLSKDARIVNLPSIAASSRVHAGAISYSQVSLRRSLEIVHIVRKHIIPRAAERRTEMLAKAYTTSMRYQLRGLHMKAALRFAAKIWRLRKAHLFGPYFLRSVIGETFHSAIRHAFK